MSTSWEGRWWLLRRDPDPRAWRVYAAVRRARSTSPSASGTPAGRPRRRQERPSRRGRASHPPTCSWSTLSGSRPSGRAGETATTPAGHVGLEAEQHPQQEQRRRGRPRLGGARRRVGHRHAGTRSRSKPQNSSGSRPPNASAASRSAAGRPVGLRRRTRSASAPRRRGRCRAARPSRCGSSSGCRRPSTRRGCARPSREHLGGHQSASATVAALSSSTMPVHRQWPMLDVRDVDRLLVAVEAEREVAAVAAARTAR